MLLQKRRNVRKGDRMRFVRGLPEIFEYDEGSICEGHIVLQDYAFINYGIQSFIIQKTIFVL